jgi:predicted peptidase
MRMRLMLLLAAAAVGAAGCVTTNIKGIAAMEAGLETGFINKTGLVDGKPNYYSVYVPREYDPAKQWPVILFLHGMGQRGSDGLNQTDVGLPSAIRKNPDRFPCLVVMPQCRDDRFWDEDAARAEQALKQTMAQYNVDPDRLYLTGLSMGGYGTWIYGARKTDVFAALMPVCGGGRVEDAPQLSRLPIWAFHGAEDEVVPVKETRVMVDAVAEAGGEIRYTEYPEVGHNCWDEAYNDPKAIRWLLEQRRGD